MSLIAIRGLSKRFAERLILDVPSLNLERGQSYLLTGSNGAGKTTLLRILSGLESANIASFGFNGRLVPLQEIGGLAPHILYMHQHPYLFNTSVPANIAYGLKANGVPVKQRSDLVQEAMAWANLQELADIAPDKLSGGEKQRVALARAKVLNPEVLLLDEPTANLDEAARKQVAELTMQICDSNRCVVIATHDPELMSLKNAIRMRLENANLIIGRHADKA